MGSCDNPQSLLACPRSMRGWVNFSLGWLAQPTESSTLSPLGLFVTSAACRTGLQAAVGVLTPAQELLGKVEPQACPTPPWACGNFPEGRAGLIDAHLAGPVPAVGCS